MTENLTFPRKPGKIILATYLLLGTLALDALFHWDMIFPIFLLPAHFSMDKELFRLFAPLFLLIMVGFFIYKSFLEHRYIWARISFLVMCIIFFPVLLPGFLFFIICVWLISKISSGYNWSRILFLILCITNLSAIPYLMTLFNQFKFLSFTSVISSTLDLIALCLLFSKEGNAWFKAQKEARKKRTDP